jgi:hypothetical protein
VPRGREAPQDHFLDQPGLLAIPDQPDRPEWARPDQRAIQAVLLVQPAALDRQQGQRDRRGRLAIKATKDRPVLRDTPERALQDRQAPRAIPGRQDLVPRGQQAMPAFRVMRVLPGRPGRQARHQGRLAQPAPPVIRGMMGQLDQQARQA